MSDISVTASSVIKGTGATLQTGVAGEAITAGQTLYIDTANGNVLKLCDVDLSALASTCAGIALHAAATGQPITYQNGGNITFNAVLVAGKVYVATATAGGIALVADLTTNWRTSILGYATSTTSMTLTLINTLTVNAS
jgi:hypothetical protein